MSQELVTYPSSPTTDTVSVIIPTYNSARYIKETLDSVFAQTYPHYEIIIVNDGSTDSVELESILLPYRSRVTYITQRNQGPSAARNVGLRAAYGDFVAFLDADDLWTSNYIDVQLNYLRNHPDCDLVYCNALFFGDSPYSGKKYMDEFPSDGEASSAAIISRRCHVFTSIMARRDSISKVAFDENLRSSEDFDCWIRFTAMGYKIGYHRQVLAHYRKHESSLSANLQSMARYNIQVLTKSLALWPDKSLQADLLRRANNKKVAALDIQLGKEALRCKRFEVAKIHFERANLFHKSAKLAAVIALLKLLPSCVAAAYNARAAIFPSHREI
jgi:glycosyltransferase involved in cell wall biosynthesis